MDLKLIHNHDGHLVVGRVLNKEGKETSTYIVPDKDTNYDLFTPSQVSEINRIEKLDDDAPF